MHYECTCLNKSYKDFDFFNQENNDIIYRSFTETL